MTQTILSNSIGEPDPVVVDWFDNGRPLPRIGALDTASSALSQWIRPVSHAAYACCKRSCRAIDISRIAIGMGMCSGYVECKGENSKTNE